MFSKNANAIQPKLSDKNNIAVVEFSRLFLFLLYESELQKIVENIGR